MPKTIKSEPHLSQEELEDRYRKAHDPVARSHYRIFVIIKLRSPSAECYIP
jgi:hypothetical protein